LDNKFGPRGHERGIDLIPDVLSFGRLSYGEPDAISNAKSYSCSHATVIRVYDNAGNVIENTRAHGQVQRVVELARVKHRAATQ
jgi:hypothetical protein